MDVDLQVHCFGFEKKQKGPHRAKLLSFQSMKAFRKVIQTWVCIEGFNYSAKSAKMVYIPFGRLLIGSCLFCSILGMWAENPQNDKRKKVGGKETEGKKPQPFKEP